MTLPPLPTDQPPPVVVTPQPVAETWQCAVANVNGHPMVVLQIQHVAGAHVSFIEPDNGLQIAHQLRQQCRQAKSGLILPPGVNPNGVADPEDLQ